MKENNEVDYKNKIKQSRELPKFRYHLELPEQKMLLCFFGQLKQDEDVFSPQEISVENIIKYCGLNKENIYKTIKKTSKSLSQRVLEYYNGNDYAYVPWFRFIRYKNGFVTYQINDAIKTELLRLYENKKIYISIDPRLVPKFKSNYGLRLYLILKGDITSHKTSVSYSLEEVCYMLSLPTAYDPQKTDNASANQRSKIIDPSVNEINEVSDLSVDYEPVKRTRRIIGWRFTFHSTIKEQPESFENSLPLPQMHSYNTMEDDKKIELAHSYGLYPKEIINKIDKAPSWSDIIQIAKDNKNLAIPILQYSMETKRKHLSFYKRRYKEIMNKGYNNYYGDSQDLVEYDVNRIISMLTFGNYEILEDPVAEEDGLPF